MDLRGARSVLLVIGVLMILLGFIGCLDRAVHIAGFGPPFQKDTDVQDVSTGDDVDCVQRRDGAGICMDGQSAAADSEQ